ILLIHDVAIACDESHTSVADVAEGAHSVPLHFIEETGRRRRTAANLRQHRRDVLRHRRLDSRKLTVLRLRRLRGNLPCDLLLGTSGEHAQVMILRIPTSLSERVLLLNQQPLVALATLGPHDGELALDLLSAQKNLEIPPLDLRRRGLVAEYFIRP